jgi:hypothetical protein
MGNYLNNGPQNSPYKIISFQKNIIASGLCTYGKIVTTAHCLLQWPNYGDKELILVSLPFKSINLLFLSLYLNVRMNYLPLV